MAHDQFNLGEVKIMTEVKIRHEFWTEEKKMGNPKMCKYLLVV